MKKIYTFFFLGLLLLTACEKLVEVDYPANQIGTEQVFEDLQTANAALSGLYASLRDASVLSGAGYYSAATLLASYADDMDCYYNDQNGLTDIGLNQQQETNSIIKSVWRVTYEHIYYANAIIQGVGQSTGLSATDKNSIIGEALFLRSMLYFYLQQIFGDIPYTTSLDYEYNRNISRTDAATVLDYLTADVIEAAGLLEDDYRVAERIYPNRKTAQLLLARLYLMQDEWTMAEQMADSVLLSPLYQFQTDINEVFHKSGTHILWQIKPENSGDATAEALLYYFSGAAPYNYALTNDLAGSFATEDLRLQLWMTEETFNGESWYRPCKYKSRINGSNTDEYSVVFRLAEAYLIKAEALARQGLYDDAVPYLNATRERAGLTPLSALSAEAFYDELLAERRREFFAEYGHRFIDLKRLDRLSDLEAVKPYWEDFKQVWPLPQSEMLLNANLSPQNTGY